ncbi:MAG: radical SAM protein [Sedimentisphaerales bacterium]|jgi:magnesium-protoporphyrin IX monomethyl ester (oxidative) cyclase|nr:radical SAM protein [Sedimentisphaerales bacterium]NLT75053.1 radical SAM protein [Planctomycetota bacterium]
MTTYKHALALNPYFGDSTATMGIFPPTGLEYIVASMKDLVGKVTLLDLRYQKAFQDPKALSQFIRAEIDLLCISVRWETRFEDICDFICQLPPEVTTVVGGYKATLEVEYLFERCPNIDMIVRGEGEEIIRDICNGLPCKDIRGLSYRENGKVVHNENRPLPELDGIPFPDRSLRTHDYYWFQYGVRFGRRTFDTVLTTRGCPFKCKFCTFSLNPLGQKRSYTERPVDSVIEELKTITADIVLFSDDNFFTNIKRSEEICDRIIASGIKKMFIVQARVDIARHPRVLDKAQQAGFKLFLFGVESPHDRILEQLQKGITQQQIRDAFAVLTKYDFHLHGYFIYGNIGESAEEMLYIPKFAKEIGLDTISFQKLRVEKFSPLKEVVESTPGYHFDRIGGPVYSDRYGRKELKEIRNRIRAAFYDSAQLWHIVRKARRIGLADGRDLAGVLPRLPVLLYRLATRKKQKRRHHIQSARRAAAVL